MLTGIKTGVIRNGRKRIVGKLKQVCLNRKKGYYQFLFEDGSFLLVKENALFFHTLLRYEDKVIFEGEEEDEVFDTYEEAEEQALYLVSCYHTGGEILEMSNPGDYPYDPDDEPEYEIVEVDD